MEDKLYVPAEDPYFRDPYIDVEEWRDTPVRHYYVHGGFHGTDINGENEARFALYFPEKEKYEGRFFQYLSPSPESENATESQTGEDNKIAFALTHGAYFVVSNQGGFMLGGDSSRLYKVSANTAEFSRKVAKRIYEAEERPYGYVFGGSGGSFKVMGCIEGTDGVWDGAVPYVMANPMAAPNVFAPRMRAVRLLGEEGMQKVVAAQEPGGSGDIYEGLNEDQKQALKEATSMGFPPKAWFDYPYMGDGALMVLVPAVYQMFPTYFKDFWEKEGYEGADPESNEARAHMKLVTTVEHLDYDYAEPELSEEEKNTVDTSWLNTILGGEKLPHIYLKDAIPADTYTYHCRFKVLDGACAGKEINISSIDGNMLELHPENDGKHANPFKELKPGDQVMIDNGDAIAMQCFHRHQLPDETYDVYDQFRNVDGSPKYAQLPMLVAPMTAISGAGLMPTGNIHGKVIGLCSMMDESACPWHGDWYRKAIVRCGINEKEHFRLYYHDNSIHDDRAGYLDDPQHQVDYLGTLHQALLDVAAWCEKGIEPFDTMHYTYADGQITLPKTAKERGGMQPVVSAVVENAAGQSDHDGKVTTAKAGQKVHFSALIEVPPKAGKVTHAAWDYEKTNDWSKDEIVESVDDCTYKVETDHVFTEPGIYYPVIKVASNRHGDPSDIFTQCKNLDRVKVIVE